MKQTHYPTLFAAAVLMGLVAFASPAMAFHDGGVAHCDGCHTMHNSVNGQVVRGSTDDASAVTNLLAASDASSVCLNCHADAGRQSFYHVLSEDSSYFSPGGDFFWTTVDIQWMLRGSQVTRNGYSMGHSLVARDFADRFQTEQDYTTAPGGSYPANQLGCNSCHDPHGTKFYAQATDKLPISGSGSFGGAAPAGATLGNYRLLGDRNYAAGGGVTFVNGPPVAVSIREPRVGSGGGESDGNHAAYGKGSSEWCANCHTGLLAGSGSGKHPAGDTVKVSRFVDNYNSYVATGNATGIKDTAYSALVPIERGVDTTATLDTASTVGATAGDDNVSCLTCHRAHASAFEYATRWDMTVEFLVDSHPQAGDTVVGGTIAGDPQSVAYYNRTIATDFNEFQRSLCNKCHLQD